MITEGRFWGEKGAGVSSVLGTQKQFCFPSLSPQSFDTRQSSGRAHPLSPTSGPLTYLRAKCHYPGTQTPPSPVHLSSCIRASPAPSTILLRAPEDKSKSSPSAASYFKSEVSAKSSESRESL